MAGPWVLDADTGLWMQRSWIGKTAAAWRSAATAAQAREALRPEGFEEVLGLVRRHESWPEGVCLPTGFLYIYCGAREATGFLWKEGGGAACAACSALGATQGLGALDEVRVQR